MGEWECERSLAQTWPSRSVSRPHLPDAVLAGAQRIAIEIELTLKSRARLGAIVEQLSWDYDLVWYFAADRIRPALSELATTAPCDNVTIHHYPPDRADWQVRADLERLGLTSRLSSAKLSLSPRPSSLEVHGCTRPIEVCSPSAR
jgi:hypothetical protein